MKLFTEKLFIGKLFGHKERLNLGRQVVHCSIMNIF